MHSTKRGPNFKTPWYRGVVTSGDPFLLRDAMLSMVGLYAIVVSLSVCHTPVLYQNGQT